MKKITVKILSIVLVLFMAINMVPVVSWAADAESQPMLLSVETVTGRPGESVQVKINLADNPGLASLQFNVVYDDILTLKDVVFNSAFGAYITAPKPYKNPQMITLISPLSDITAEGTLATLTFEISENAADNYTAEIGITYRADDVYNGAYENIALSVEGGSVKVYHGIPGDIDGDMQVNTKDAILLFRYIAGWDVTVDHAALDVNMDDQINTKDAITLFRYVAGWDVEIGRGMLNYVTAEDAGCETNGHLAYWYCNKCDKYFSDKLGMNEISAGSLIIPATGHTPGEWIIDAEPTYETAGEKHQICAVCSETIQTVTIAPTERPESFEILSVSNDVVTWSELSRADSYRVIVNKDYSINIRNNMINLNNPDLKFGSQALNQYWASSDKTGKVSIEILALDSQGTTLATATTLSIYIPESDNVPSEADSYMLGHGYDMITKYYLDVNGVIENSGIFGEVKGGASTTPVLNLNKLATVAPYHVGTEPASSSESFYFSDFNEFSEKSTFNISASVQVRYFGSYNASLALNGESAYSQKSKYITWITSYNRITGTRSFSGIDSHIDKLQYCLSDEFRSDIECTSSNTAAFRNGNKVDYERLCEFLYQKYGTHVILGVLLGGRAVSQYSFITESASIFEKARIEFKASADAGTSLVGGGASLSTELEEEIAQSQERTQTLTNSYIIGGDTTVQLSSGNNVVSESWRPENPMVIGFVNDTAGAIAISDLIRGIDAALANEMDKYLQSISEGTYKAIYEKYEKTVMLPVSVETEDNINTLVIDLSAYHSDAIIDDDSSPYLNNHVFTVYPTMLGKDIDKIKVVGQFDKVGYQKLVNSFTIRLADSWTRDVDIICSNLGVICASNSGFVDDAAFDYDFNIHYEGINVIQTTDGRKTVYTSDMAYTLFVPDGITYDIADIRLNSGILTLPVCHKEEKTFVGWKIRGTDDSGIITDRSGMVTQSVYESNAVEIEPVMRWVYTIKLYDENNTLLGKYYERYGDTGDAFNGFYSDSICENEITKIDIPQKPGYYFAGYCYYLDEESGERLIVDGQGNILEYIDSDCDLYTIWEPMIFAITADNGDGLDAGTFYVKNATGFYYDAECEQPLTQVNVPISTGKYFIGYYWGDTQVIDKNGQIIVPLTELLYTGNATWTAHWSDIYTITFVTNGGSSIAQKQYHYNSVTSAPSNPTRQGWIFTGWSFDGSDGFYFGKAMPDRDIVATANWERRTAYSSTWDTFEANGKKYWDLCSDNTFDYQYFIDNGYSMKVTLSFNVSFYATRDFWYSVGYGDTTSPYGDGNGEETVQLYYSGKLGNRPKGGTDYTMPSFTTKNIQTPLRIYFYSNTQNGDTSCTYIIKNLSYTIEFIKN